MLLRELATALCLLSHHRWLAVSVLPMLTSTTRQLDALVLALREVTASAAVFEATSAAAVSLLEWSERVVRL